MRWAVLVLCLPSLAGAQELAPTDVASIARAAFKLSVATRMGTLKPYHFAAACAGLKACVGSCVATLKWLVHRHPEDDFDVFRSGETPTSDPPPPDRFCDDALHASGSNPSARTLETWARKRLLALTERASRSAGPRDATIIDCSMKRLVGTPHKPDPCPRAEAFIAAEWLEGMVPVDPSMLSTLVFQECAELDGCSGPCRAEFHALACSVAPCPLPRASKCRLIAPRPHETVELWRHRATELAWAHVDEYWKSLRPMLPPAEQETLDHNRVIVLRRQHEGGFGP